MRRFLEPPTTYKEATYRAVHHSPPFTVEQIAEHLNVAPSTLYSMANRNMYNVELPRKHVEPIVVLTGTHAFAEYFSHISGGIHVPLPKTFEPTVDVIREAAIAMDEAGHVFSAVADALKDNGHVDKGLELKTIENHARHVQVSMARVVVASRRDAEGER